MSCYIIKMNISMRKLEARQFILDILAQQRVQTAGTSLEPSLPLTTGNL